MAQLTLDPVAEGHFLQWTPSPAGAHYVNVDDGATPDEDTTQVNATTIGQIETFRFPDVSAAQIPDGSTINWVQIEARCMRAGGGDLNTLGLVVSKGTVDPGDVDLGAAQVAPTAYGELTRQLTVDPFTGAAWPVATLRALQTGAVRDFGVEVTGGSATRRTTRVRLLIDWTASATTLGYVQSPTDTEINAFIANEAGGVKVEARLSGGARDTAFTGAVTLLVESGTGALTGTNPVNAVAGLATFPNLALDQEGTHSLRAQAVGYTDAVSAEFEITKARRRQALVRNLVRETSATTGVGDVALSGAAATRYRTFDVGVGVGPRCFYFIVHQTALEWEEGIGYLSGSAILVRETVLRSSNANTLVSFSAGTKDVFCDVGEHDLLAAPWAFGPRAPVGEYLGTAIFAAPATRALTADTLYLSPILVPKRMAIDRIALEVTTLAASSTIRLGLYGTEADAKPSRTMFDAATVASDTTGLKTITINETLDPGVYWAAVKAEGGGPTVRANPNEQSVFLPADSAGGRFASYSAASMPTGTLPVVFPTAGTKGGTGGPRILLRRSA